MRTGILSLFLLACRAGSGPDLGDVQTDDDSDGFAAAFDCDDADATVHPAADELCDAVDNDCDGAVDEVHATNDRTWYADRDGDGAGDAARAVVACEAPADHVDSADDCDDTRADVAPDVTLPACGDPIDYDCDGTVDFADADADGHAACDDCDDDDDAVHPGAFERCNGDDDDCDDDTDEDDAIDALTWYADADDDGFGAGEGTRACDAPEGSVSNALDCDDDAESVHPGAAERCDGVDHDCDGDPVLGAFDAVTYYTDADGDAYGTTPVVACAQPAGTALVDGDCDDTPGTGAGVNPGAAETCDGTDRDCDGSATAGATDATAWYRDLDADGHGDAADAVLACAQPAGRVAASDDCDDLHATALPAGEEVCDGLDNDCNELVDDAAADRVPWYADADGDGWGDPAASTVACTAPADTVANGHDCDDDDDAVHPLAVETCNGTDDDCDSVVDRDAADQHAYYVDRDEDDVGDDRYRVWLCADTAPAGYATDSGDCDDDDATAYPGATPACDDADNDCQGGVDFDADGDGWSDLACGGSDCADDDDAVHPGAAPTCADVDANCDGAIDDDADRDGFSDEACGGSDCDDSERTVFPGAPQACDDLDHDCDGEVDFDGDGDDVSDEECGGSDCDDANPGISQGCLGGTGADGPLAVASGSTAINAISAVGSDLTVGSPFVFVLDGTPFHAGDEILVMQVQGTGAGTWELHTVANVSGTSITILDTLAHDFRTTGTNHAQVVRVPNYTTVSVSSGARIHATDWDGLEGGVVALRAWEVSVSGAIDANGSGYRGGIQSQISSANNHGWTGESYTVSVQRGNSTTTHGGGGSSYCSCGEAAGPGGYGTSGGTPSGVACSSQPNGQVGGTYGAADLATLYFGSGGGGGCRDDGSCEYPPGQDGGGLVLIIADRLTVSGSITSDGNDVIAQTSTCDDTIGGAGAGGSVWIAATDATLTGTVRAIGGTGQTISQSGVVMGSGGAGRIRFDFETLNGELQGTPPATTALNAVTNPDAGFTAIPDI